MDFRQTQSDYGLTHLIKHKIPTEGPLIRKQPYKTPYHLLLWLDVQIKDMEKQGVIKEAVSECFPLVIVRKKDNTWRCCVGCRALNAVTVKDVMKLPRKHYCKNSRHSLIFGTWYFSQNHSNR